LGTPRVYKFFQRIITEVITYREKNNVSRADYLQHLINLKKKGSIDADKDISNGHEHREFDSEQNRFTDVDIYAQASTFFADGYETSSGAMAFGLYCLAVNPDVQAKVRDEVDSVLKKHDGQLTFDAIQEMTYLDMALSEALRMYPPAMAMIKLCTKPFKLPTPSGGTYEVEVGTPVVLPLYAIHCDPQHFPDPKRYDPERFSEGNKQSRHRYSYLPFGEGPRMCLGFRFALMQVKAGIATVINRFRLLPNKRTPVPVKPDPNYFMFAAKGGLWLDFEKRTDK
ncbi:cytochrome P450 9e2, partial [Cryptotermes secundus]|uniref:cytochrome P450 9e2 n=1 Tax=Cryptotermes secundus TaxID=105785 RepID=UPI000CD7C63E